MPGLISLFIIESNSSFLWPTQLIKDWWSPAPSYLRSEYGRNSITKKIRLIVELEKAVCQLIISKAGLTFWRHFQDITTAVFCRHRACHPSVTNDSGRHATSPHSAPTHSLSLFNPRMELPQDNDDMENHISDRQESWLKVKVSLQYWLTTAFSNHKCYWELSAGAG